MHSETNQGRMRRLASVGVAALAAVAVTGCAHNDVLVFGTNTTLGLNVQSAATGAGPSIVVGYERQEAVWMPLIANGRNSRVSNCPADAQRACLPSTQVYPLEQAVYQSTVRDASGTRLVRTDAYSVFASLGADFNSSVNTANGANAGGGIAQFFATGAAAQNITANPALVTALKVGDGEDQAQAVAAASLSEERLAAIEEARRLRDNNLTFVLNCATQQGKDWATLVRQSTIAPPDVRTAVENLSPNERSVRLRGRDGLINPLVATATAAGCTR